MENINRIYIQQYIEKHSIKIDWAYQPLVHLQPIMKKVVSGIVFDSTRLTGRIIEIFGLLLEPVEKIEVSFYKLKKSLNLLFLFL